MRKVVLVILAISVLATVFVLVVGPAKFLESLGFRLRAAGLIPDDKVAIIDQSSGIAGAELSSGSTIRVA
jgi:hypothetical protein